MLSFNSFSLRICWSTSYSSQSGFDGRLSTRKENSGASLDDVLEFLWWQTVVSRISLEGQLSQPNIYIQTQIVYRYNTMSSNISTGLTVAAGMIGSLTLVLPKLFHKQGIIGSLVGMIFMGVVYCRTCQLWMIHWKPGQEDISQIVKRTLGKLWYIVLGVSSGILLLLICVIYFLLLNQTLYPVITYILGHVIDKDKFHDDTNDIHFEKFSIQYLGFIMIVLLLPFYNLTSIDKVVKFAKYGMTFLIIYFFTLVGMFITNVVQHGFHEEVKLMPENFDGWIDVLGQFSLAFVSHNTIITVTKNNHSRKQIPRAIAYGFTIAGVLYALFGVFGGLSKYNQDYFKKPPFLIIIGVSIFFYVICIYGIFPFVSRAQFFCWRESKEPLPKSWFYGYNLLIILICVTMQTVNVSPGIVIAITGTGVGIITCFILPIWIHLRCYRPRPSHLQSIITDSPYTNNYINQTQIEAVQETDVSSISLLPPKRVDCVAHEDTASVPYSMRVVVCSVLMVVGVVNLALQVKLIIDPPPKADDMYIQQT